MFTYKDIYSKFIEDNNKELSHYTSKNINIDIDIKNLLDLIKTFSSEIAKCMIICNNTKININYFEGLIDNPSYIIPKHVVLRFTIPGDVFLTLQIQDYIKYYLDLITQRSEIRKKLVICKYKASISLSTFKTLLGDFNFEVSKYILEYGYNFNLGNGLGGLSIIKKKRKFIDKDGKESFITKTVDWGESIKQLKYIASIENDITKKLLNDYTNKLISKYEFIDNMKPYLYNKDSNPNGKKWIIYYTSDYSYWWHWYKGLCKFKNKTGYSFVPTNYIETHDRSQINFVKTVDFVDEILNSKQLGTRDKLMAIVRFSDTIPLNYKEYGL